MNEAMKPKMVAVYQNGRLVEVPYWDYMMQKAKEDRLKRSKK